MRAVLFLLCLAFTCNGFSKDHLGEWIPRYKIVSDEFDSSLKPGTVKITGRVYKEIYDSKEGRNTKLPVQHVKISTVDQRVSCLSAKNGSYTFTIADTDSVIYMYKYGLTEVVIIPYDFKSQHVVTIDFMPTDATLDQFDISEKPVIYMYSDDPTEVEVSVNQVGTMTFTYPEMKDSWKVSTGKDGTLTDADNNQYPYLFWEAERNANLKTNGNQLPGEYVRKEDAISFLESALNDLGLNFKEKTDFITYWGPRLQAYEKTFVQFSIDDDVAEVAGTLSISPAPSNIRRVFMTFIDANKMNYFDIMVPTKQQFSTFSRTGLTVVEWGGTELTKILSHEN